MSSLSKCVVVVVALAKMAFITNRKWRRRGFVAAISGLDTYGLIA